MTICSRAPVRAAPGRGRPGVPLLLPAAAPVAAADPVVLRVGTTQDLDSLEPVQHRCSSSGTRPSSSPTTCSSTSTRTSSRARASPTRGSAPPTASRDVPHPRRHEVVRRHAGDVRRTSASRGASRWTRSADDAEHRRRATSTRTLKDAGVTKVECPDDARSSPTPPTSPTASSRSTCRSCPSTSGASTTTRRSPTRSSTRPLVGTGPYTLAEWKTGQFARFVRNPNYWGKQGFADEVVIQFFSNDADTHGPGAQGGRARLRPRRQPGPVQAAPDRPDIHGRRRQGERLDASSPSTPTAPAPARPSRTAGRPPRRCSTRRSATPSATPSTRRRSSTACSAGSATSAPRIVPPVLGEWHVEPDHPAHLRHRARQAEARRRRLPRSTRAASASTRRASRSRLRLVHPELRTTTTRRPPQFVKEWYGQLGIDVTTQSPTTAATLGDAGPAARGRRRHTADYDIELWGWAGNPDPNGLLADLPLRRDRQHVGQPVLQPGLRQAVRPAARRQPATSAQGDPRRRCRT